MSIFLKIIYYWIIFRLTLSLECSFPKTLVASASTDFTIKIWDLDQSSKCTFILKGHKGVVNQIRFNKDSTKLFSVSDDNTIKIWDASTGNCLQTLKGHKVGIYAIDISPKEDLIATGDQDNEIIIWKTSDGSIFKRIATNFSTWIVKFSPDGVYVLKSSWDSKKGDLDIFNVNDGKLSRTLKIHEDDFVFDFTPDGKFIVAGSKDGLIRIIDFQNQSNTPENFAKKQSEIYGVAISNDGRLLACSFKDSSIIIWEFKEKREFKTLTGHSDTVWGISFTYDSKYLMSASSDSFVNIWDIGSGNCLMRLKHNLKVYDVKTGVKCVKNCVKINFPANTNTVSFCDCQSGLSFIEPILTQCTSIKINSCKECSNTNFFFQDNSCYQCPSGCNTCINSLQCEKCIAGYFLDSGICCPSSCIKCNQENICEKCGKGFYFLYTKNASNINIGCTKCQELVEYVDENYNLQDGTGFCLSHYECKIDKCEKCSKKYEECAKCSNGYYIDSTNNKKSCTTCQQDRYFSENLECHSCKANCKVCKNISHCEKCDFGFYLEFFNKTAYQSNCNNCASLEMYIDEKFSLSDGTGLCLIHSECLVLVPNCKKCQNKYKECSICESNFYLNEAYLCSPCNKAGELIQGFRCVKCPGNCDYCTSLSNCEKCATGFYLLYKDINTMTCTDCKTDGSYIDMNYSSTDGTGLCLSHTQCKIENCIKCSNKYGKCYECNYGYFLNPDSNSSICSFCEIKINGVCKTCEQTITNCLECQEDAKSCKKCKIGFFLLTIGSESLVNTCDKCESEERYKEGNFCKRCSEKFEGCKNCNSNSCILCKAGYFLSHSANNNGKVDMCSKCEGKNQIRKEKLNHKNLNKVYCHYCEDLLPGCSECDSLNNTCSVCKVGFYEVVGMQNIKSCKKCSEGECSPVKECEIYNDYKTCERCKSPFFLSIKTISNELGSEIEHKFSCLNDCPEGYFANNTSKNCSKCKETCKTCESSDGCTSCQTGLLLFGRRCIKNCEIDEFFVAFDKISGECKKCSDQCLSCFAQDNNSCLSCRNKNEFLKGSKCVKICDDCSSEYNFTLESIEQLKLGNEKGFVLIFTKELNIPPNLNLESLLKVSVRDINKNEFKIKLKLDEENKKNVYILLNFNIDIIDPVITVNLEEYALKLIKDKNNVPLLWSSKFNNGTQMNLTFKEYFEGKNATTEDESLLSYRDMLISFSSFVVFANVFSFCLDLGRISTFWLYLDALQTLSLVCLTDCIFPKIINEFFNALLISHLSFITFAGKVIKNNQVLYYGKPVKQKSHDNVIFKYLGTSSFMCNGFQGLVLIFAIIGIGFLLKFAHIYYLRKKPDEQKIIKWLDIFKELVKTIIIRSIYTLLSILSFTSFLQLYYFNNPEGPGSVFSVLTAILIIALVYYFYKKVNKEDVYNIEEEIQIFDPLFNNINLDFFLERNHYVFIMIRKVLISIVVAMLNNSPTGVCAILLAIHLITIIKNIFKNPFNDKIIRYLNLITDFLVSIAIIFVLIMARNTETFKSSGKQPTVTIFENQKLMSKLFVYTTMALSSIYTFIGFTLFIYYALKNITCLLSLFSGFGLNLDETDENKIEDEEESERKIKEVEITEGRPNLIVYFNK